MTKREFIKKLKAASAVYVCVNLTTEDCRYIEISKRQARDLYDETDDDTVVNVLEDDGDLLIG